MKKGSNTRGNTLKIDPSPDFRGTGKLPVAWRISTDKMFITARVAITGKRCGCVQQDWQAKDGRGRWVTRFEQYLYCDKHYPDFLKPDDYTGGGKVPSLVTKSRGKLFVDARVVLTQRGCGCTDKEWQSRNEWGRWKTRSRMTFACPDHFAKHNELWRDLNCQRKVG